MSPLCVRTRQEDIVAWDEQNESALLEAAHQESKDIDLMLFGPDGGCCEDDDDESKEPGPRPKRRRTETAASSSGPRHYTRRVETEIARLQSPDGPRTLIPTSLFVLLCCDVVEELQERHNYGSVKLSSSALELLQYGLEAHLTDYFADLNALACHGKRQTRMVQDSQLWHHCVTFEKMIAVTYFFESC